MSRQHSASSSFASCFFPTTTADNHPSAPPPPPPPPPLPVSGKPNITTCFYQTHLGLFSLTWSRTFLGHSLHLKLHPFDFSSSSSISSSPLTSLTTNSPSRSTLSFHLHIKPFLFWKKHGSKKLTTDATAAAAAAAVSTIQIYWDLSRAKFGSGPEPQSGFYIAVVFDGEITLLVGDSTKAAYSKTKAQKTTRTNQVLVLRREHVFGNKVYTTKAKFGGKTREISIDCSVNSDAKLSFSVDNKRVLQIKRLQWKFRGNERVEVDGVPIQISWDVYNWLFEDMNSNNGRAVFMFRFENLNNHDEEERENTEEMNNEKDGVVSQQQQPGSFSFGMNGNEWKKMMRKSLMRTARSSSLSSISMSSASSSGYSSSVMEWASTEESELCPGFNGFSLLVYAWKN